MARKLTVKMSKDEMRRIVFEQLQRSVPTAAACDYDLNRAEIASVIVDLIFGNGRG